MIKAFINWLSGEKVVRVLGEDGDWALVKAMMICGGWYIKSGRVLARLNKDRTVYGVPGLNRWEDA